MSKIPISVHPLIKKIIQNLDLDLGAELSRYEKETVDNAILIPELIDRDSAQMSPSYSNSSLVYTPTIEEEPIPVASRLISNEGKSLLDLILTPWGIFGIIIFFGTNIFIFLGLNNLNFINNNQPSEIVNQPLEEEANVSEITNQTEENNLESNPNIIEENQDNITPPPLPSTLPTPENIINPNNFPPSPYPDLKTALMTEISKNESSLNETSLIPPPPPLMEEIIPNNLTNNSNNNPNNNQNINPNNNSPEKLKKSQYLVMTNYQNMNQFNNIQKIIPNALITNIGGEMKIQLGVFKTEAEAKSKSQQWQKQGIKTFVN